MTDLSRTCPVGRVQWGFAVPMQGRGLATPNGSSPQFSLNNIEMTSHELRVFDSDDYMMYCIYCGALASQLEWYELLKNVDVPR